MMRTQMQCKPGVHIGMVLVRLRRVVLRFPRKLCGVYVDPRLTDGIHRVS
jgi:hypothetical protein